MPPADRRRGEIVFWSLVGGRWSLVGGPGLHVLGAFWGFGNSLLGTSIVDGEPGLRYKFETAAPFSNSSTFGGQAPPSAGGLSHL